MLHPEDKLSTGYTEWTFPGRITRMPEFTAPSLGARENLVTVDAEIGPDSNGVLYALGGFSGGLSLYMLDGVLSYEYNLFEIERTHIRSEGRIPTGKVKIEVETRYLEKRPTGPLTVTLRVNGKEVAKETVPVSAPILFTANDCLDIGTDLGSPVSIDYFDKAPFEIDAKLNSVNVKYLNL